MAPVGSASNPIRVLVAEDNLDLRAAVVALINDEPDMQCVGEAAEVEVVAELTQSLQPDVVLLDWELRGQSAKSLLTSAQAHSVAFIVLSGHAHPQFVKQAIEAGARDFVVKNGDFTAILASIRRHGSA